MNLIGSSHLQRRSSGTKERKSVFRSLSHTLQIFGSVDTFNLIGGLAYYAALSLSPLLVVIVVAAGWVGGRSATAHHVVSEIKNVMGNSAAQLADMILEAPHKESNGVIAIVIAAATLLLGAIGVFVQLQRALNRIWEVRAAPRRQIWQFIRVRLLSFSMILLTGLVFLLSMAADAAISFVNERLSVEMSSLSWIWQWGQFAVTLVLMIALFAFIYKILPDAKIAWREVWFGAIVTSILMTMGKFGIRWYVGHSGVGSAYGAAGSVIALLVWVYYASMILLLGACLTRAYAIRSGKEVVPKEHAELLHAA